MGRPRRTNPERNRVLAECGGLCSAAGMGATVFACVIRSQLDGTIYVGRTTGVARRLATRNSGGSAFTARHQPWALDAAFSHPAGQPQPADRKACAPWPVSNATGDG
jgi:hypothetical protein